MKATVLFSTLFSTFAVLSVALVLPFVNLIFLDIDTSHFTELLPSAKTPALGLLCLLIWCTFLLKNVFYTLSRRSCARLQASWTAGLRDRQLRALFGMDFLFLQSAEQSTFVSRIVTISSRVAENKASFVYDVARIFPLMVGYLSILIWLNWQLVTLILLLIPLLGWIQHRTGLSARRLVVSEETALSGLLHRVQQSVQNMKLIRLLHMQPAEESEIRSAGMQWDSLRRRRNNTDGIMLATLEMLGVTIGVALLYFVGRQALSGHFTHGPGGFVLFVAAVFSLIDPTRELLRAFRQRRETAQLSALTYPEPEPETTPTFELQRFGRSIVFDRVAFGYGPDTPPVFTDLCCTILPGDRIAVVGTSGIGKSTWGDLLVGLLPPTAGSATIDGIPLHQLSPASRARLFGITTQEPYIFHAALRNNLSCGQIVEDEHLFHALEKAGLKDWFQRLPHGLETRMGDRGLTLSGGERQRLSLARLILRDPEILLLDEATSSLDAAMENELLHMMFGLFALKTIVVISHRTSILKHVDKVWQLGPPKKPNGSLCFQEVLPIVEKSERNLSI